MSRMMKGNKPMSSMSESWSLRNKENYYKLDRRQKLQIPRTSKVQEFFEGEWQEECFTFL